jgi:hypothetical protein
MVNKVIVKWFYDHFIDQKAKAQKYMSKVIAMIPAAGRGSRMFSLTDENPKAMLPLRNKPLIRMAS